MYKHLLVVTIGLLALTSIYFFTIQTTNNSEGPIFRDVKHDFYKVIKKTQLKRKVLLSSANGEDTFEEKPFLDEEWENWKKDNNKVYSSPEEDEIRKKIFEDNLKKQEELNEQ